MNIIKIRLRKLKLIEKYKKVYFWSRSIKNRLWKYISRWEVQVGALVYFIHIDRNSFATINLFTAVTKTKFYLLIKNVIHTSHCFHTKLIEIVFLPQQRKQLKMHWPDNFQYSQKLFNFNQICGSVCWWSFKAETCQECWAE